MKRPEWMGQALCAKPEYQKLDWFPERLTPNHTKKEKAEAIRKRNLLRVVCKTCPVMVECDAYAKAQRVTGGVWAGKNYGYREHSR